MKTHQKAGLTGALKNLVGINGAKAYLVHHRKGLPSQGGDEFPESVDRLFYYQARFREFFQKRSRFLFRFFRLIWRAIKRLRGIQTVGTPDRLQGKFYLGSGSWHGNDSIWRMVYDLNRIILFASAAGGALQKAPQRRYVAILDGLIAAEGNGPLQPIPVAANVVAASDNPFLIDLAMAKLMGFDYRKIRQLAQLKLFPDATWGGIDPEDFEVTIDGVASHGGLRDISPIKRFLAPPGWAGQIELEGP